MRESGDDEFITLFLCGDVMTGRGVDQALPHPSDPILYEPHIKNAIAYVRLVEQTNGPIPTPLAFSYIWGDALAELERVAADVRIINLETSITRSGEYWKGKGIHYRMVPENIACITAAKIDCCALANNHVLDWGYAGLQDTLTALAKAGVKSPGAGRNRKEAEAPGVLEIAGKDACSSSRWAWPRAAYLGVGRPLRISLASTSSMNTSRTRYDTWQRELKRSKDPATSWSPPSIGEPTGDTISPLNRGSSPIA